jgi:hypothetical protein
MFIFVSLEHAGEQSPFVILQYFVINIHVSPTPIAIYDHLTFILQLNPQKPKRENRSEGRYVGMNGLLSGLQNGRRQGANIVSITSAKYAFYNAVVIVFILCSDPVYYMSNFVFCFSKLA